MWQTPERTFLSPTGTGRPSQGYFPLNNRCDHPIKINPTKTFSTPVATHAITDVTQNSTLREHFSILRKHSLLAPQYGRLPQEHYLKL